MRGDGRDPGQARGDHHEAAEHRVIELPPGRQRQLVRCHPGDGAGGERGHDAATEPCEALASSCESGTSSEAKLRGHDLLAPSSCTRDTITSADGWPGAPGTRSRPRSHLRTGPRIRGRRRRRPVPWSAPSRDALAEQRSDGAAHATGRPGREHSRRGRQQVRNIERERGARGARALEPSARTSARRRRLRSAARVQGRAPRSTWIRAPGGAADRDMLTPLRAGLQQAAPRAHRRVRPGRSSASSPACNADGGTRMRRAHEVGRALWRRPRW